MKKVRQSIGSYYGRLILVMGLFASAIFLPRYYFSTIGQKKKALVKQTPSSFKLGIDNMPDDFLAIASQKYINRIGLITNAAVTFDKKMPNVDILLQKGLEINKIFIPEQPLAKEKITNNSFLYAAHNKKIPCTQFYIDIEKRLINTSAFKEVDMLIVDLQDMGMRHYNCTDLLYDALVWAAHQKKQLVVLDRPNPLGNTIEGAWQASAIQHSSLPLCYGMTMGELADYFNKKFLEDMVDLKIIPMANYNRLISPSLAQTIATHIDSFDSCVGYSFLGLLAEVAPFDTGTLHDMAYQCVLLPEHLNVPRQQWFHLRSQLQALGIESKFYNYYNEKKQLTFSGLQLKATDLNNLSPVKTLITLLTFFKKLGVPLSFSASFDQMVGSSKVRDCIEGRLDHAGLLKENNQRLKHFFNMALDSFIYKPLPRLAMD